jgi:competence protein ComEA
MISVEPRPATDHVGIGQASILPDVPRDPEARGFVRLEQQHPEIPKKPCASGSTPVFLLSGNLPHSNARTRQDSLRLSLRGSRGTSEEPGGPNHPKRFSATPLCLLALYALTLLCGCDSAVSVLPEEVEFGTAVSISPAMPEPDPEPAPSSQVTDIMVEVQGAVSNPGTYRFPTGARIHDAMDRAGGATTVSEIRDLNIAARLLDGSVLSVPYQQQHGNITQATAAQLNPPGYTRSGWGGGEEVPISPGAAVGSGTRCVNLNTATQQELEELPGVGPKTAAKIMRYREQQPFASPEDLRNIQGIGEKRLESLRGLVCI